MNEILVAPSILSGNFAHMGDSVKSVEKWGGDWVHCDVMDGNYVTNITFGMPMISAIRRETNLNLDVHLMINKPEKYVKRFVEAGANIVTFHPEVSDDPLETLKTIKANGALAGMAFNPNVEPEQYEELFSFCDIIVIMTVYAGYGGQKLIPECLEKVKKVKKILKEKNIVSLIEVDGGVNEENAPAVIESGANVLVAGSSVFKSTSPAETIKKLKSVTR